MAKHSPAAIDLRSKRAKAVALTWQNPEIRAARSAAISAAKKGRPGYPHTEAEKEAASVWMKKAKATSVRCLAATESLRALGIARRGATMSPETRENIRYSMRRHVNGLGESERATWVAPLRRVAVGLCRAKASRLEKITCSLLDALDVKYQPSFPIGPYIADIYIPDRRLVIECDGSYWHGRPGDAEKDARRDEYMKALGYTVLRLPEAEIKSGHSSFVLRSVLAVAV